VVERLPSKIEVLSSNHTTRKKKEKKTRLEGVDHVMACGKREHSGHTQKPLGGRHSVFKEP
jgi:hypothetical protein